MFRRVLVNDVAAPIGLTDQQVRFSWQYANEIVPPVVHLVVTDRQGAALWRASVPGTVTDVAYGGPAPASRDRLRVTVTAGNTSPELGTAPSIDSWWEMGLVLPSDWSGRFITADRGNLRNVDDWPPVLFEREFNLSEQPGHARLYATANGVYKACLNGHPVSDARFRPGYSDYNVRQYVDTVDVTPLLRSGTNRLQFLVADGWWLGEVGFDGRRATYGHEIGLLAQLEATDKDGLVRDPIVTDADWTATTGPVRASEIFHGERYDDRPGLVRPRLTVRPADEQNFDQLVGAIYPPVRAADRVVPQSQERRDTGETLVDFGENLSGIAHLEVDGAYDGQLLRLTFAEHLNGDGTLFRDNYNEARTTDELVLSGGRTTRWSPEFSYRGFRYLEITGLAPDQNCHKVEAIPLHSDVAESGRFTCSDDRLNDLYQMAVRSMRANLFEVLTDCPQRNERLGWLGDGHVIIPSLCRAFEARSFLNKWLLDILDAQTSDGTFPTTAPRYEQIASEYRIPPFPDAFGATPGWSDGGVLIPVSCYEEFGDERILRQHYDSMRRWIWRVTQGLTNGLWVPPEHPVLFTDSLESDGPTDPTFFCTAFLVHTAEQVLAVANALGDAKTSNQLQELGAAAREAITARFLGSAGPAPGTDTQTSLAMWSAFKLSSRPEQMFDLLTDRLAQDNQIRAGFFGTKLIFDLLVDYDRPDIGYELINSPSPGSFSGWIAHGMTTLPEHWQPFGEDGSPLATRGNSLNHYALGSYVEWLFAGVGGLQRRSPGWGTVVVRPPIAVDALEWADVSIEVPQGRLRARWERSGARVDVHLDVPAGITVLTDDSSTPLLGGANRFKLDLEGRPGRW